MTPNQNPTCTCAFDHEPGCALAEPADLPAWGWCQAFLDAGESNDADERPSARMRAAQLRE